MSKNRRDFIKVSAAGSLALLAGSACAGNEDKNDNAGATETSSSDSTQTIKPVVVSTWNHGMEANAAAWELLSNKGSALDAVEQGVRVTESDPKNSSVGLGGFPDRDGNVTLDACIMNEKNDCGSVAFLQHIENPISVARKVMEETPHVMIVGDGALEFALDRGFEKKDLLTENSKKAWKEWLEKSEYKPIINIENHDTIGMLAMDEEGNLSGACTTSGLAFKMRGRVGDSPIIGAGLFVDNEIGAATATGVGEMVIRTAGAAIIVEMMRHGKSPQEACEEAVRRIISKHEDVSDAQVGFIAMNKKGEVGCHAVHKGFNIAYRSNEANEMRDASFEMD